MRQRASIVATCLVLACGVKEPPDPDTSGGTMMMMPPAGESTDDPGAVSSGEMQIATDSGDVTGAATDTGETVGGCGNDPGFVGAVSGTIEAARETRRFLLVLPDDYDPSFSYPIVYMWHGRGSNGEQLRLYAGVEAAAAGAAIFVYPDGLPIAAMNNATGWELGANDRDIAFFDVLHAELTGNLCIDDARVYASGHSFGGFFSNALGCIRGDVLRAIAPVAGGGPGAACTGMVAALVVHGEDDPTVPTLLGEGSRNHWADANGCGETTEPVDPPPCEQLLDCTEGYEVLWCLHTEEGLGLGTHTWPAFAGPAIWSFFASH